jgi:hypothetical protein
VMDVARLQSHLVPNVGTFMPVQIVIVTLDLWYHVTPVDAISVVLVATRREMSGNAMIAMILVPLVGQIVVTLMIRMSVNTQMKFIRI